MEPHVQLPPNSEPKLQNEALPPGVLKVIVGKEWNSGTEEEEDISLTGIPPRFDPLSASSETDDDLSGLCVRSGGGSRLQGGKKSFNCSECDKMFHYKCNLKRHMRRHTGEKPFCCSVCSKTFRQHSNLVVRSRTHTGAKPFSCSLCHTSFSQRISLVVHVRTHTGEKPFPCSVCGERFSRKGNMMSHMRRHTGEKPFSCAACDKRFTFKCQVSKHECEGARGSSSAK